MDKPRVKPLTFRTVGDGRMALSPVGPYRVLEQPDGFFDVMFDGCLVNRRKKGEAFSSYEAAEAWAQSRHEKQVLECLAALKPVAVQRCAECDCDSPPDGCNWIAADRPWHTLSWSEKWDRDPKAAFLDLAKTH